MRVRGKTRPCTWATAGAVACVLTLARGAGAQVNAEVVRPNPLRPGFSVGVDGNIALARGNIELFDMGIAGRLQYQTLHPVRPAAPGQDEPLPFIAQRVFLVGSGRYADKKDVPFISQSFLHTRWTAMWHERVGSELFAQHQQNRFFRLQRRNLIGAGVRVEMVHEPAFMLWGGSGYMLEFERIDVLPGASDRPETVDHRWTSYLTARLSLSENRLFLQNTVYYQPRFDDFTDFRALFELEALSRITDLLAFGATLGVLHDGAPPTGVKPTDLRLATTVRLSL